jgi:hypothetical protein
VLFQFHHACCDGLAALQFVQDFLGAYKVAAGTLDAPPRELDPQLLRSRGKTAPAGKSSASRLRAVRDSIRDGYVTARVWASLLFRPGTVLAAPGKGAAAGSVVERREILSFEIEALDTAETARLHGVAASLGATANDILLRDFFLALDDWNERHAAPRGRLRVLVPVNVRTRADAHIPAANRIGFGFVTASARERCDPRELLDVVMRETRRIKEWKLALYFLGGLAVARKWPFVLRWALRRNRSFATAVLSNVGRFLPEASLAPLERWTCGDLVLTRIAGVPPLRRLTRAAVIVAEYSGATVLCLRCDPNLFTAAQTREVLSAFSRRVRETLREAT